jgi:hypothetical protein
MTDCSTTVPCRITKFKGRDEWRVTSFHGAWPTLDFYTLQAAEIYARAIERDAERLRCIEATEAKLRENAPILVIVLLLVILALACAVWAALS